MTYELHKHQWDRLEKLTRHHENIYFNLNTPPEKSHKAIVYLHRIGLLKIANIMSLQGMALPKLS